MMGEYIDYHNLTHEVEGLLRGYSDEKQPPEVLSFRKDRVRAAANDLIESVRGKERIHEYANKQREKDDSLMKTMYESKRAQFIVSFIVNVGMFVILAGLYLAEKMK